MAKATTNRTRPSAITVLTLAASVVTAVWAAAMMTPGGRVAYVYVFAYAEYYLGVLTLVALSLTVMLGLIATDRLVLSIRQRVVAQSAHRASAVVAVVALALHVGTKLAEGHVRPLDAVVPFLAPGPDRGYLGLGTVAGLLLLVVMWTGVVRARFAGRGRPWVWRSIHVLAYPMWPLALVHGLSAGRPAAPWVMVGYVLCVLGVLTGLALRLSVSRTRRASAPAFAQPAFAQPAVAQPAFAPPAFAPPTPTPAFGPPAVAPPAAAASGPARIVGRHAVGPDLPPPDETPTLVDLAGRRARNEERRRAGTHTPVPRTRRTRRRADDGTADIEYWRQIRREAR